MKHDVIIIGSGLGGLECAHILASEGYNVLVLEREAQPGGCMQSYRRNGLEFDTGFHYIGGLGEGEALHAPFRILGLLRLPWVRLDDDCFDRIHIAGESYDYAQGFNRFAEALSRQFPAETDGLRDYVAMLQQSSRHQLDWLDPTIPVSSNLLATETYSTDFTTSAWGWLNEHFRDSRLIDVLSGNSTRMELRKDTLPLFTLAHINSSYIASSYRLKGSGRLIVDSLIHDIRANGGKIVRNAEVSRLIESAGRIVSAVCSNGETYEADLFVSDVHPMLTYDLINPSALIRKSLKRRMHLLENTYGMMTISLVIKPGSLPYVGHNDYIYSHGHLWDGYENDKSVSGELVSYRVPENGGHFTRIVDIMTPVSWSECSGWQDSVVGQRGKDYEAWKQWKSEEAIALAATVIPDLESIIEAKYVSTPLTYRDYTLTPCGSAYGLRKDCASPLLTIVSPHTPVPNLFLTGQSLMLHGVEGVTMTAMMTCAEIIGKERMWEKLKKQ